MKRILGLIALVGLVFGCADAKKVETPTLPPCCEATKPAPQPPMLAEEPKPVPPTAQKPKPKCDCPKCKCCGCCKDAKHVCKCKDCKCCNKCPCDKKKKVESPKPQDGQHADCHRHLRHGHHRRLLHLILGKA